MVQVRSICRAAFTACVLIVQLCLVALHAFRLQSLASGGLQQRLDAFALTGLILGGTVLCFFVAVGGLLLVGRPSELAESVTQRRLVLMILWSGLVIPPALLGAIILDGR